MKSMISLLFLLMASVVSGQTAPVAMKGQTFDINILLLLIALFLLIPIRYLATAFVVTAKKKLELGKKPPVVNVLLPFILILLSQMAHAQDNSPNLAEVNHGVNSQILTFMLLGVIALELFVMILFAFRIADLVRSLTPKETLQTPPVSWPEKIKQIWTRLNFKPIEQEAEIDTGHDYDGIRELDNVIPPWFTTAFLVTILIAAGYLYRYHIAKSAPGQIEEYKLAMAKAEIEHDAFLARQANSVDENSVAVMTGPDLEAGQKIFTTICATCHRADGGGQVGPNLTDAYWIHGGSLKSIFKTIKYGVPDKGMISWKDQLSPTQIAQVSNYILTLAGTNPPDPKEKQGVLFEPEQPKIDSTQEAKNSPDSLIKR